MINAEQFRKMTMEQQNALDPLELLASALHVAALQLDEGRAAKDATTVLNAIGVIISATDRLEEVGTSMLKKIVTATLKQALAKGEIPEEVKARLREQGVDIEALARGEAPAPKQKEEPTALDFGLTMKPAKA